MKEKKYSTEELIRAVEHQEDEYDNTIESEVGRAIVAKLKAADVLCEAAKEVTAVLRWASIDETSSKKMVELSKAIAGYVEISHERD